MDSVEVRPPVEYRIGEDYSMFALFHWTTAKHLTLCFQTIYVVYDSVHIFQFSVDEPLRSKK